MMKNMMRQMNMKEVDAEEVIIKTKTSKMRLSSPKVMRMEVMGQTTFQITGEVEELLGEDLEEVNDDDIELIMQKTGCSEEEAREALSKSKGDLAQAIMDLKNS